MSQTSGTSIQRPPVPLEIIMEITGRCRQHCPYCANTRTPDIPWSDIKATLDEAASLGIKVIRITGGDPLLHPDIQTILTYSKAKKFAVIMNTTAENISPPLMRTIITSVEAVLISLQGYNENSNAAYTRTKHSFLNKIQNIYILQTYIPALWLATVITPALGQSFTRYLPLIKKIKPAAWLLQRPISDFKKELQQMGIPFFRALTLQILKARQNDINVFISNPIPLCITGDLRVGQEAFFGANLDDGHLRLVRSARGFFKPSYFLETDLGNTIQAAWNHPFLHELDRTDYLPGLCQKCPVLSTCRGGCRAMALRAHGTVFAPDPLFSPIIARKALSKTLPKRRRH